MTPLQAYLIVGGIYAFIVLEAIFIFWWMRKNNTVLQINIDDMGAIMCKSVRCRKVVHKGWLYTNGTVRHQKIPVYWWNRYNTVLSKKQANDSALQYEKVRYYWMWDIFKRKPYKVNNADCNEMVAESMPIIGVRKVIRAEKQPNGEINAYSVSRDIPDSARISLNAISWISESRHELYEETKHIDSAKELFAKMAIPIGMVILALACLVFFPKIYTAIMEQGNAAASGVGQALADSIKEMIPKG